MTLDRIVFGTSEGDGSHNQMHMDDLQIGATATVPEPITLLLPGSGLTGIAAARARRRKGDAA